MEAVARQPLHVMCRAATAMRAMGLLAADAPPTFRVHRELTSGAGLAGEIVHAQARRARRPGSVDPGAALARVPGGVVLDRAVVWTWGFGLVERAFSGGDCLGHMWDRIAAAESTPGGLLRVGAPLRALVGVPMFEYQWRCVAFMLHREQTPDSVRRDVPLTLSDGRMYLSLRRWALCAGPARDARPAVLSMRGGCILDQPGMGKTRQVLVAALLDRDAGAPAPRGVTLVVCKSHLVRQWEIEAAALGLAARTCVSIPQLRNLTLAALRATSVVIVSVNALERYARYHSFAAAPGEWRGVRLERCHFRRVVVDEAHSVLLPDPRILDVSSTTRFLHELSTDFRWAVTGTPSMLPPKMLVWFLGLSLDGAPIVDIIHGLPDYAPLARATAHLLGSMSIRRSARAQLGERLPDVVVQALPVDLLPEEMSVINTLSTSDSVRRALCHPQAADEYRGSPVRVVGVADLLGARVRDTAEGAARVEARARRLEAVIEALAKRRDALATGADAENREERVGELDRELQVRKRRLASLVDQRRQLRDRAAYLRNAASSADEPCIICTDPIRDVRAVAQCGHSTCGSCMDAVLGVSHACPVCRAPICKSTITRIRDPAGAQTEAPLDALRARVGSKTAAIVTWLRNTLASDPGARVLVYCMFDRYLHIMDSVFRAEGIETGWIMGNAPRRDAIVADFQEGKIPVLLASLERAAEGLNLTRGTHVLFVHPMDESQHDLIRQAGGRINRLGQTAPRVHYVYAFARNTVEQVLVGKYPPDLAPTAAPPAAAEAPDA